MGFIKRLIIGGGVLLLIFSGAKSDSLIMQIGALIGVIIALVFLYILAKMAWRAMGCLPAILIIAALSFFVMYSVGFFSGEGESFTENLQEYFDKDVKTADEFIAEEQNAEEQDEKTTQNQKDSSEDDVVNLVEEDKHKILTENLTDKFFPKNKKTVKTTYQEQFNPLKYPAVYGSVRVLSGDTLVMNNMIIKLYGVAAPDIKQTCADQNGRGYRCGRQSAMWLSDWLMDNEVECHILQENTNFLTSVCLLGSYDIGAAIVNAGWAVANTGQTGIYSPYQSQAANNRRGMWSGKFYMPWDWQKIQNRKADIKIIHKEKKGKRKSMFSFF